MSTSKKPFIKFRVAIYQPIDNRILAWFDLTDKATYRFYQKTYDCVTMHGLIKIGVRRHV
jgi:hypothetical protein